MEVEKRILGWAGLTPHEVEVVRLVFQALGDKLIEDWKLDEHARNDVVIANPLTSHGKGALSEAPSAIAVVDRFGKVPDWIDHHLIRPLRPRALVESMNATCTKPAAEAEPETLKTASESTRKSLAQALHDATTQANPDSVHVIDGIGDAPLIVDAVRNRLCG
ncbi:hypothetical protein, partial [Natronospira sp.]|uniref:hypothetical protein n=1 Tax=Natronospira sp. TaxID=2024970 RepID=UPI00387319B3